MRVGLVVRVRVGMRVGHRDLSAVVARLLRDRDGVRVEGEPDDDGDEHRHGLTAESHSPSSPCARRKHHVPPYASYYNLGTLLVCVISLSPKVQIVMHICILYFTRYFEIIKARLTCTVVLEDRR